MTKSLRTSSSLVLLAWLAAVSALADAQAKLEKAICEVHVSRADEALVVRDGMELLTGDVVETGPLSAAILKLPGDVLVKVRDQTRLVVRFGPDEIEAELQKGRLWLRSGPHPLPSVRVRRIVLDQAGAIRHDARATLDNAMVEFQYLPEELDDFLIGVLAGRVVVESGTDVKTTQELAAAQQLTSGPGFESQPVDDFKLGGVANFTQGQRAQRLILDLGFEGELPPNATERDAVEFLTRLGLTPCSCQEGLALMQGLARIQQLPAGIAYPAEMVTLCLNAESADEPALSDADSARCKLAEEQARAALCDSPCISSLGQWELERPMNLADLACILGERPNVPFDRLPLEPEAQIELIRERYPEIFWLQTRRRVPVSPFAP